VTPAIAATEGGLRVMVRLTPKGGRDALEDIAALADGREVIRARVRAAPEDGAANAALIGLMAKVLGIAKSDTVITAGHTSRLKTIDIRGDSAALAARLAAALKDKSA
jgi:uncharacterized protein YggU (UPF0235/DUF167 family)